MSTVYENITTSERVSFGTAGWTATKVFVVDGCDMSNPDATITSVIENGTFIPPRGEAHQSGKDMQADLIEGEAFSSTQVKVTVSYRKLTATELPANDAQAALMTIGSSVQEQQTNMCKGTNGDKKPGTMIAPYTALSGSIPFYVITNIATGAQISTSQNSPPTCFVKGQIQVPNTVVHFSRRETKVPTARIKAYMTKVNSVPFNLGDFVADAGTVLCTRIEGSTPDGGTSYVVDYEFQYSGDTWDFAAFYTLPVGTVGNAVDGSAYTCGAGNIPVDAAPTKFQMYDAVDFNQLALYGAK